MTMPRINKVWSQTELKELLIFVIGGDWGKDEQFEIVRHVEEFLHFANGIEQKIKAAQSHVDKLTQSILAKAFRGEFTVQWRDDNPDLISGDNSAEALLARIQAEREAAAPKKKTRAKKKTS